MHRHVRVLGGRHRTGESSIFHLRQVGFGNELVIVEGLQHRRQVQIARTFLHIRLDSRADQGKITVKRKRRRSRVTLHTSVLTKDGSNLFCLVIRILLVFGGTTRWQNQSQ